MMNSSTIFLATTTIIIVILIMTIGTGISSSLVFAQTDFGDLTVTDSSENLVDTSGLESPQQQPQGPLSPPAPSEQQSQPLPSLQQSPSEQPSEEPTIR
jgi:hypothetical protein